VLANETNLPEGNRSLNGGGALVKPAKTTYREEWKEGKEDGTWGGGRGGHLNLRKKKNKGEKAREKKNTHIRDKKKKPKDQN